VVVFFTCCDEEVSGFRLQNMSANSYGFKGLIFQGVLSVVFMCCIGFSNARADAIFYLEDIRVDEGATQISMPLRVKGFEGIGGFQFTLGWNANVLQLVEVTDFNHAQLPNELFFFGEQNFNLVMASQGLCPVLYEQILSQDVNLPDDSHILTLVFQLLVPLTAPEAIEFVAEPTPGREASFFGAAPNFVGQGAMVSSGQNSQTPTIELLGSSDIVHQAGIPFEDPGARVILPNGESFRMDAATPLDIHLLGPITLDYIYQEDVGGTQWIAQRNVQVVDTFPPYLELLGEHTLRHPLGQPYLDAGAVATDLFEGPVKVEMQGEVQVHKLGTYLLKFFAQDTSGNVAKEAVRSIEVVTPTISPISSYSIDLPQISITFPAELGRVYAAEHADHLHGDNWQPLQVLAADGASMTVDLNVEDSGATGFYRVVSW